MAHGRYFFQVTRFDRIGAHGRRGFATLFSLDNAYYGMLDNWGASADRLQRDGWLSEGDADLLRVLYWFGGLIGNADMHFANVSLALDDARPLSLAPAYDMLPMHYRPAATGEVLMTEFKAPLPMPQQVPTWLRATGIALVFWERVQRDSRISDEFRAEASRALVVTRLLRDRFG